MTPDDMRAELARSAAATGEHPLRLPLALRASLVVAGLQVSEVATDYLSAGQRTLDAELVLRFQ
ncbi:MAG: hypothetical protein H0T46_27200 [Deltaproteobacteria bacterium]|nr:hypothetical protein [Deltaproteobacteria bacterium]